MTSPSRTKTHPTGVSSLPSAISAISMALRMKPSWYSRSGIGPKTMVWKMGWRERLVSWVGGGVGVGTAGGAAEVPAAAAVSLRCCGSTALPFPLSLPLPSPSTASPSPSMDVTTGAMLVEGPDFPGDCDSGAGGGEGGEVVLFLPLLEEEEAMSMRVLLGLLPGCVCAKAGCWKVLFWWRCFGKDRT